MFHNPVKAAQSSTTHRTQLVTSRPRRVDSDQLPNQHPKTILIVDDDHEIVLGAQMRLRAAGYRTLAAGDGSDGVTAAIEHVPDAIVMDIRMPRKNGFSAMADLQQHKDTKSIPIVMLSASVVDRQAALDAGARFFLSKPYDANKLLAAVGAAIN